MVVSTIQYFPAVSFWAFAYHSKKWCIEAHENYNKRSARNRTTIASSQGALRLSIPLLKGKNQQMPIQKIAISNVENWQKNHWQSILSAYGKSPYFLYYEDIIKDLIFYKTDNLWDYNWNILETVNKTLQLGIEFSTTTEFCKHYDNIIDIRYKQNNDNLNFEQKKYGQLFEDRQSFLPDLSILDLLFCVGPEAVMILKQSINVK